MGRFPAILVRILFAALLAGAPALADTLLVVRKSADALDLVDPGSGLTLASVAVGHAPHEVSVAPDGKRAAVSNYGTRDRPGSSLSIVDLEQPREQRRIELAPHTRPHGVAWFAPDRVAVTTEGSAQLLVVDAATGRIVDALPTRQDTSHMVAVAPGGARAYVANIGSGTVTALDIGGQDSAEPAHVGTGAGSEGLAVTPDGSELWVAARADGRVTVLAARSMATLARFEVPGVPIRIAIAPDGARAYVSCAASSEVVAFDIATRRETARRRLDVPLAPAAAQRPFANLAPGSALPVGLAVARDSRSVFVAATMADRILQLDARTLDVLRTITVNGESDGLGVTPVLPRAECHACAVEESPGTSHHTDP
jgi:DNA-binding beta-propeller fold protein YncE